MPAAIPPMFTTRRPLAPRILGGVAVAAILAGIWWASTQQSTVTRKAAEDSVLIPVVPPPPPPPPPPEQVKPPEPQEVPPQPVNQPTPQPQPPSPTPQAAPSQGQAVSIDGPPQAGGDAFNIGSGSGNGRTGAGPIGNALGGFNSATYGAYLQGEIHRALESDKKLRTAVLRAHARIWIDKSGRITRAEVTDTDKAADIQAALVGRTVRPPDPSLAMPVSLSLDFQRSG